MAFMIWKTMVFKNKKNHFLTFVPLSICYLSLLLQVKYDITVFEGRCKCTKFNLFEDVAMNLRASTPVFREKKVN